MEPEYVDIHGLRRLGITWSNGYMLQQEKKGLFVRRLYLSPNKPVWPLKEILAWIKARVARGGRR